MSATAAAHADDAAKLATSRAIDLVRRGRLYPSVILHGGSEASRREAAVAIARSLLCERAAAERPCGRCRHCLRVAWPEEKGPFHPDFAVLERDLKTSTSVEATRAFLRGAHLLPFEACGQVFAIAAAETLSPEGGDALLKAIEEPATGAPRHFLLLAPSRSDLPATLRSRSLALFLGAAESATEAEIEAIAAPLEAALARYLAGEGGIHLFGAASVLAAAGDTSDPRAALPWSAGAAATRRVALAVAAPARRPLLALAEALLSAREMRLRGIAAERIVEGLVARHLGALVPPRSG